MQRTHNNKMYNENKDGKKNIRYPGWRNEK